MLRHTLIDSPLGAIRLVADDAASGADSLIGLYFDASYDGAGAQHGPRVSCEVDEFLARVAGQLADYFAGVRRAFDIPIDLRGNDFQVRVWEQIAAIEFGHTRTYGEVARDLGGVGLAQAVGRAAGQNPVGIVVGCHRVVGADGKLVGYAGGLKRKRYLLDLEEPREVKESRLF
ncbi:methylated-DNA--[protein]-cysteine S-methyltransferase [Gordonia sp. TBRC 11910]|uniref:methylated-DNA--[protein]-cysteine S-methyltransferase n=1 Tax=Gordonia asplenii TaxID=2725283 RepID=A0A848KTM9_9ACTN|nr:methylated-DNA--[protein]-cysteine S-methyltransferase [Gordonia asplenii]NMO00235.1 methylated-DNA--[protein]-cysteine S-methyltransferase [Gordonia asplenii]